MFKAIILNNNIEVMKNICNSIINELTDVQLSGMATTLNELNSLIKKVHPDIIFLNYSEFSQVEFRNLIKDIKQKIIFYSSEKSYKNSTNRLFISENNSTDKKIKSINEFILKENHKVLRNRIIDILKAFPFDFKLVGTFYILESILYCYENKTDYVFENLERKVYPNVATICNCKSSNIKWAIVRSINAMHSCKTEYNQKLLSDNFKVDISEKTTAKQLISTIVAKL